MHTSRTFTRGCQCTPWWVPWILETGQRQPLHPFLSVLSLPALIKLHSDLPLFCIKEYLFCKILLLTLHVETRNREEGRLL